MAREDWEQYWARIITPWVQGFMERFNIVGRRQCDKLMIHSVKQTQMEKDVAFHLGSAAKAFRNGDVDEDLVGNTGDTHFVVIWTTAEIWHLLDVVRSHMLTWHWGRGNYNEGAHYRTKMLLFSLHLQHSRTNAAIIQFVVFQTQSQACITGLVLKAGWINECFQNGYLSDGVYANIFMTVSKLYFWTAVLVIMRWTSRLRSYGP